MEHAETQRNMAGSMKADCTRKDSPWSGTSGVCQSPGEKPGSPDSPLRNSEVRRKVGIGK